MSTRYEPRDRRDPRRRNDGRGRLDQRDRNDQRGRVESNDSASQSLMAKVQALLATPQLNYIVICSITLILTFIGLTMVLSASMVDSYASQNSVWKEFLKQASVVVMGLVGMWCALRMEAQTVKKYAWALLAFALVLLVLVLIPSVGVGADEVGSNSWIRFGPIGVQPSEVAKLALAVWGSAEVADRMRQNPTVRGALGRFLVAAGVVLVLVVGQRDLGMMFAVGIVVFALMFFSGMPTRVMGVLVGAVSVVGAIGITAQSFRSARITTWLDALTLSFSDHTTKGDAYQSYQGILSLSDGGLLGTGLGQSRSKWFYLPEAKNDFIFAVVGEELGFVGAGIVVLLFALLGWFGIRTARAQRDPFLKMMAATLTIGIVVQAFFNMGYVVGFLPVTGIQLPLISAGGSSAIITLITLGLLANCARHEPATISSMQHEGRPLFDRLLMLPEPRPYKIGEQRREKRRSTTRTYGQPVTQRGRDAHASQDVRREQERREQALKRAGVHQQPRRYDRIRRQDLPQRPSGRTSRSHRRP
ncbi:putative lipid II flippase FtsW [Corynebacterium sp. 320]|uniref:putative lipid II flippase FtsW n=1 Tax=Corynebacterium TaxID=1716 RepID=UPI00125CBFDE|nr:MULTISPECIES: putative lipid II flippase FtsW [Corynebacterium]KAB1502501.1 putative lipid II flippase FtsW [Corynebacterium sp. 320]KAB1551278.1 putative lipid II flippase FtsW [Corynebacterium sp. 321]KAB1551894.1 putative lipid II flippase FtsW [Corynebacterium sp. 319]KAB3526108.1 putative lipid II flippase FtsW [Corynebacterium sp. 250]KAB3538888.1 putative lipid II flippase FtsW [Corynebacterium sp. 366]